MKRNVRTRWDRKSLMAYGLPAVLIPGVLFAIALGWNPSAVFTLPSYYANKTIFPSKGVVNTIIDGDTFTLKQGQEVRLLGINAPGRGEVGYASASAALTELIDRRSVYLEYDRYQDDKYGRILAWVWIGCERTPHVLPANYMHKSGNESNVGLFENPIGCKYGTLVNELLVDMGMAIPITYTDRGKLKYEDRIRK